MSFKPQQAKHKTGGGDYGKKKGGKRLNLPPKSSENDPRVIDKYKARMLEEIEKRKKKEQEEEEEDATV